MNFATYILNGRINNQRAGHPAKGGKMEKYSKEWKLAQGKWIQKHGDIYKIHYIENDTEYSTGEYLSRKEAENWLKDY
jgi:hypothetical protein